MLSGSNVSSRNCCSICASRSLSFPVSRIICFHADRFPALARHRKSPRPDHFPHQKDGRRIHFQIRPAPRGWCAPGVGTVWRTLPAGYYQYRWQTNCDLTPGRGGYKADHITPVHHKTNISQLTKMVYQTFDRLTQLSVSLMRIPQWIGNPQHGKSSAINSGSSGGTGWSARRCQWRPISCAT